MDTASSSWGFLGNEEGPGARTRGLTQLGASDGEAWVLVTSPVCVSESERQEEEAAAGQEEPLCSEDSGPQRLVRGRGASRRQLWRGHSSDLASSTGGASEWGLWAVWAGWGALCCLRREGVGTENWLPGRAGTAYLVGPPRGIGHLVSETFSRRKELRVRRGREMKAAPREGTGRRWLGGDPTRRPLWPSEDLRGPAVHSGTVSYPPPSSQVCSSPRPLGGSGAEKGTVLSGGRGDGREDRCGSGRFQTSISCAAQCSLQNRRAEQRVTPSRLSWWSALATLQRMGCPVLGGRPCLLGLGTPAREGTPLFPERRLSRARAVLQCRRLTVKAGPPCLPAGPC